jgi:pyridoxine kinase
MGIHAVCDPVMGDAGRLYVGPELPPCYRDEIVGLASVMTPNQFEMEQLVGHKVVTEEDAVSACQTLHARGPSTVVSSMSQEPSDQRMT